MKFKLRRSVIAILVVTLLIGAFPVAISAEGDPNFEGSGTLSDPFLIQNADDLWKFDELLNGSNGTAPNNGTYYTSYYRLTADIVLTDCNAAKPWTPVGGKTSQPFKGYFDGNGHSISGLYINSTVTGYNSYAVSGMFGYLHGNSGKGWIRNLTLKDYTMEVTAPSKETYCGGFGGFAISGFTIENCAFDGNITVTVNENDKAVTVLGVGGILGRATNNLTANYTPLKLCANRGTVSTVLNYAPNGDAYALGGIIGLIASDGNTKPIGTISQCWNSGSVQCKTVGKYISVGGIAGKLSASAGTANSCLMENCYNVGEVAGYNVGGLAGTIGSADKAVIKNCFGGGTVNWTLSSGGSSFAAQGLLVGNGTNLSSIENCYFDSTLKLTNSSTVNAIGAPSTDKSGNSSGNNNGSTGLKKLDGEQMPALDAEVWVKRSGTYPILKNPNTAAYGYGTTILKESVTFMNGETKVAEGQGLKFTFVLNDKYIKSIAPLTWADDVSEVGVIIAQDGKIVANDLTVDNCTYKIRTEHSLAYDDTKDLYLISGHIIGIPSVAFDTGFSAKAYVIKGGETFYSEVVYQSVRGEAIDRGMSISDDGKVHSSALELKVMSLNLLSDAPEERVDTVVEMIEQELPDTFGTQECQSGIDGENGWYELLPPRISEKYGFYSGEVTDARSRLYNAVFYRKDKFELIPEKSGSLLLSQTATDGNGNTRTSKQNRKVTWVALRDKMTGKTFVHYNLHLDYDSWAIIYAQLADVKELTDDCQYPYVITGDFNVDCRDGSSGTGCYQSTMCNYWMDARAAALNTTDQSTSTVTDQPYVDENGETKLPRYLDYCFLDSDVRVSKFSVVTTYVSESDYKHRNMTDRGMWISDHLPIYAEITIS